MKCYYHSFCIKFSTELNYKANGLVYHLYYIKSPSVRSSTREMRVHGRSKFQQRSRLKNLDKTQSSKDGHLLIKDATEHVHRCSTPVFTPLFRILLRLEILGFNYFTNHGELLILELCLQKCT